ncbi:MAG: Crp/Fnr family transcriptional regulator [Pyrinomonadaceae bacterium]|nr:Crp/Fnr family transcriptional regulator [Pyrinomonadaceae bacterium]
MYENLFLKINQLVSLSDKDRRIITGLFVPRKFEKGDYLLQAGSVSNEIAFVENGIFRHFLNRDGDELIYAFCSENEFVSDYESFLSASVTDKNIQAVEAVSALVIDRRNLEVFYREVEHGERFGRLAFEQIFVNNLRQMVSLYQNTPAERYRNFVAEYKAIQNRVPQYYVASFVGVKPESLSRIRRRIAVER